MDVEENEFENEVDEEAEETGEEEEPVEEEPPHPTTKKTGQATQGEDRPAGRSSHTQKAWPTA